ncbi:MAG: response regulator transcription factor [Bacteroidales bacterium]|jgi:DNA-binding response OmpR family regulator|nr:response regulator transcription factor [Bacteroidales bacterium]MBR0314176.1 response regulator transcription factor [Bacteroidales bacterium]MBR6971580.1 response regulator transcription factor [Bacteroidales bacterium]
MIRLLIVEDDTNLSFLIKRKLEKQGDYIVETAIDGREGLKAIAAFRPDIVVSDLEMGDGMDGNTMIERIRETKNDIPIIVLTGKMEFLKQSGANMYLKKPFNVQQLDLNIKSMLQQKGIGTESDNTYKIGKFTFDTSARRLILGDEEIRVTPTGAKVLEMLCREMGKCVDRKKIQGTIWGDYDNDSISHNLDVQIDKLRGALKADPDVSIEIIKKTGIILKG